MRRKPGSVAIAAVGAALAVGMSGLGASAAPAGHALTNKCPSTTRYLQALGASYHKGGLTIVGHSAYRFCDSNSEYLKARKKVIVFQVEKGAPVRVLSKPYEDPNKTHMILDSRFPRYLAHQHVENFYSFKGNRLLITSLKAAFQS